MFMTHPISFSMPLFVRGREKREGWVIDTGEFCLRTHLRANGWRMYGMDSKLKLEDQLKNFGTINKLQD